jgi:hypothetical protein
MEEVGHDNVPKVIKYLIVIKYEGLRFKLHYSDDSYARSGTLPALWTLPQNIK